MVIICRRCDHFSNIDTIKVAIKSQSNGNNFPHPAATTEKCDTGLPSLPLIMTMRVIFLFGAFLVFCFTMVQVSSDIKIEEELPHLDLPLVVKGGNRRLMQEVDCGGLCKQRCSVHSRPNVCNRACGTCCVRCKCVPPGTAGNRELCGACYTDMTTHGNRTKCP